MLLLSLKVTWIANWATFYPVLQPLGQASASLEYLLPASNVVRERFAVISKPPALGAGIPEPHLSTETRGMRRSKRQRELRAGIGVSNKDTGSFQFYGK